MFEVGDLVRVTEPQMQHFIGRMSVPDEGDVGIVVSVGDRFYYVRFLHRDKFFPVTGQHPNCRHGWPFWPSELEKVHD